MSSSVTVNVLSSFPESWLISFCTSLVSIKICRKIQSTVKHTRKLTITELQNKTVAFVSFSALYVFSTKSKQIFVACPRWDRTPYLRGHPSQGKVWAAARQE